jgi:dTMP kinase
MPLIVLEGPEGAGKTTQIALLFERMARAGTLVVAHREPGGTAIGEEVRKLLLETRYDPSARTEALLFMASRAQLIDKELKPALDTGTVVLLDRFFLSTYAYQIGGRRLPEAEVRAANALATAGVRPDLNILLDLPPQEGIQRAARRGAHDRMEQADAGFHDRVSRAFAEFATTAWQTAHPEAGRVVSVDARGTEAQVHERVVAAVNAALPGLLR